MTQLILAFFLTGVIAATSVNSGFAHTDTFEMADTTLKRGKKIDAKGAISVSQLVEKVKKDGKFQGKVEAKILSCCQKKGCWMMVDLGNGEQMRVTFKDYGFFVPLESAGRTVVMQGKAWTDTTSVEMLRHYAEDAGKSKEEIMAITEPEIKMVFEADGLILK
ncbi:MAG: DUF4920 domain-containing protein [Chitinophagales bacterium]|nr:DUF4920 domain-containing protein [Chitinophagales bacterium]